MATMQSPLADKKSKPGRRYVPLEVTRLASGADLRLGLHVLTGHKDGPTLGVLTTIHGDETFPLMAVRELLNSVDAKALSGRIAAIPVANPLAVTVFNRQTPEQHGKTDLHEVFPGSAQGNLTQKLAGAITANLLDHVDALVDMHCGGLGGRLQSRADLDASANSSVYEQSLKLCRAFNTSFVHANNLAGTAARYCNGKGVPTVNPEIGGVYLGPQTESAYLAETVAGLQSVMAALGMIPAQEVAPKKKQLLFNVKSRFEIIPSVGGFLQSRFASPGDLGRRIEKGELLGEMIDIHTLDVAEELRATVSGYLFFALLGRGRCRHKSFRSRRGINIKMAMNSVRAVLLAPNDNVAAAIAAIDAAVPVVVTLNSPDGIVLNISSRQKIPFGHKIAIKDLTKGSPIVRYGYPIGVATADIKLGDHVHSHNMRSALSPASAQIAPAREIHPADWICRKIAEVLLAADAHVGAAEAMASAISEAHLRGVETHGLRRLRPYLARIRSGGVDAKAQPAKEQHGGLLMIDGRNAIGHDVASEAAKAVSDAAAQFGIAIAIVRNSNHFGFAGYYATMIAQRGQIGIVTSNGQVCVGPKGAKKALLSNNPLAIAAPTGRDDAFLELDLATSVTSRANVVEFAKLGQTCSLIWRRTQQDTRHAMRQLPLKEVC